MNILKLFEALSLFCCLAYARPTIEGTESVSYPTAVVDGSTGQGEVVKIEGDANPDKAQELLDGITTSELETEQTTNATSIPSGEKKEDSISEPPVSEEQNRVETPNSLELGEPTNPEVRMGTAPGELVRVPVPTSSEDPSSDVISNIVVKPAHAFNGSGVSADAELYGSTETSPNNNNSEPTTPHYVTAPEDDGYIEKWGLDEEEVKEKIEEAYVTVSGPDAEVNTVPSDQTPAEPVANLPGEENASSAVENAPTISEESATIGTNAEITAVQDNEAAPGSVAANLDTSGYDSTPSLAEGSSDSEDDALQQVSELTTGYSEVSEVPSLGTSADVEVSSGEEPAERLGEQAVTMEIPTNFGKSEEAKAGDLVSEQVDAVEEKSQLPTDQLTKEAQKESVEEGSGQQTQSENIESPDPTSSGEIPLDDNSINTPPSVYPEFVSTAAAEIVSSDAEILKTDSNDSNAGVTTSYSDSTTSLYSRESLSDSTESDTIEERESSGVLPSDLEETRVASPSGQVQEVQTTEGSVSDTSDTTKATESHKKELAEVEVNAATVPTETSTQTSTISAANDKPDTTEVLLTTTTVSRSTWKRYEFDCDTEVDDKGFLCKDWALGGLCEVHPPTRFLFCRKTCLCTGPQ